MHENYYTNTVNFVPGHASMSTSNKITNGVQYCVIQNVK
jgi:hypothetical protein